MIILAILSVTGNAYWFGKKYFDDYILKTQTNVYNQIINEIIATSIQSGKLVINYKDEKGNNQQLSLFTQEKCPNNQILDLKK